jgi:hypothetical protein
MAEKPPDNIIRPSRFSDASGGAGPRDPGVETRLAALETDVREIRLELQAIRVELAEIKGEIRGKLSNLPTTFQLVFMQAGFILAAFAAAFGFAFALLKLAAPS